MRILSLSQEPNPVGEARQIDAVEDQLIFLASQWDKETTAPEWVWYYWAMPWKWGQNVSLFKVTDFLIKSLDRMIEIVEEAVDLGPDKKATVLNAISRLYDYVVREAIPVWLRPFSARVKDYIVNVLVSTAIDWIVDKYNNGEWRNKPEEGDLATE